jgi:hypothetical protein
VGRVQYLYRVFRSCGVLEAVEVGIYDPDRWQGEGGMAAGLSVTVSIGDDGAFLEQEPIFGDDDSADLVDVCFQAENIAEEINVLLGYGVTLAYLGDYFEQQLAQDPRLPADRPYVFADSDAVQRFRND